MSRFRITYFIIVCLATLLAGCTNHDQKGKSTITVSIQPLESLVRGIVGDDYDINTLLPSGSSPESYSPTPSQLANIEQSEFTFIIGTLNFEHTITHRLSEKDINIVNTGKNAALIEGKCSHNHHINHDHHHSIDPHIWLSLVELEKIVHNIGEAICAAHPDSVRYKANYEQLITKICTAHDRNKELFEELGGSSFIIYHPALTYFARDYGIEQISVEHEGKTPTPAALTELAKSVNNCPSKQLLYQREYPLDVVKSTAEILELNPIEINPLDSDILTELDRIANILSTPSDGK